MKTILIVDDQKTVLMTIESILKPHGFIVVACTNSVDAFDRFTHERFDLVITDAVMPMGENGFTLISSIRQQSFNKTVPIIMLTGKRDPQDVEKAISVGANDYMIKPIDPDILIAKVKKLLENKSQSEDFVEAAVNSPAQLQIKLSIVGISETHLILNSNVSFIPGQIQKIQSMLFKEFGHEMLSVRMGEAENFDTHFRIKASFVGLSEKELSQIRLWVRSRLIETRK